MNNEKNQKKNETSSRAGGVLRPPLDARSGILWTLVLGILLPALGAFLLKNRSDLYVTLAADGAGAVIAFLLLRGRARAGGTVPRRFTAKDLILSVLLMFFTLHCLNGVCRIFLPEQTASSGAAARMAGSGTIGAGTGAPGEILLAVIGLAVLPAIYEELLMRGILFRSLRTAVGFWPAALLSAAFWGIWHWNPAQCVTAFGAGLVLALLMEVYDSLTLVIFLHMANNLMSVFGWLLARWIPGVLRGPGASAGGDGILLLAEGIAAVWLFRKVKTGEPLRRR